MKDWIEWHRAYDDPESSLARRLLVVRRRVQQSVAALGPGARRVLSLCSGDGRDLIHVLTGLPRDQRPAAILVENDHELAEAARKNSAAAGLDTLRVVEGDAGDPTVFVDFLPVDLLLLCGIFGNISDDDVKATIASVPSLLAPGGFVIWTRGNSAPDLRPQIRRWFVDTGLVEQHFDGDPEPFGVGVSRLAEPRPPTNQPLPQRLFVFVR